MLLLLLSLTAAPPVAVDIIGMEPQLTIVRRDAAERGWRISCEGRAGEENVIRLSFPSGTPAGAIRSYFDPDHHLGSSAHYYYLGDALPDRCDHEPTFTSSSAPLQALVVGPGNLLERLAVIARACGYSGAAIRARRSGDIPAGAADPPEDWVTLDAGEDAGVRYGPSICFVQMQYRALSQPATETH